MKLALGTSQFIKSYGVQKKKKNLNNLFKKKKKIINNNFDLIDTSPSYGNALKEISNLDFNNKIVTKIKVTKSNHKKLYSCFLEQLKEMKKKNVYAILIHNVESLNFFSKEISFFLKKIKKEKLIKKYGFSIYEPSDINIISKKIANFDIIQVPLNVLDTRILKSKWYQFLIKNKIEIHCRSCFLQGLLLKKKMSKQFSKVKKKITDFKNFCIKENISPQEGCIEFVKMHKPDYIIIGFDNLDEMNLAIKIFQQNKKINFDQDFSMRQKKYIDPRFW